MKKSFDESGMTFEFEDSLCFRIEKSPKVMSLQTFMPCECIVLSGKFLDFYEAKSSAPNPHNKENLEGIRDYYDGIEQKFLDSLLYLVALMTKRHEDRSCPNSITSVNIEKINFRFYIIIRQLENRFLPDQTMMFQKKLKHIAKAWNINDYNIKVLNEDMARSFGLIK